MGYYASFLKFVVMSRKGLNPYIMHGGIFISKYNVTNGSLQRGGWPINDIKYTASFISTHNVFIVLAYLIGFSMLIGLLPNLAHSLCYDFEDGKIPPEFLNLKGSQLFNGTLQIGLNPIFSKLDLQLNQEADVSFDWKSDFPTQDLSDFSFSGPNHIKDSCNEYDFERRSFEDLSRGRYELSVLNSNGIGYGYLDNFCIEYLGANVTNFSIEPLGKSEDKRIDVKIVVQSDIKNCIIELLFPDNSEFEECVPSGFLSGSEMCQANNTLIFNRTCELNSSGAIIGGIRIDKCKFPEGKHFIKIKRLVIDDVDQHSSLLGCTWELNTAIGNTTAEIIEV
jgi:hypothetical protein